MPVELIKCGLLSGYMLGKAPDTFASVECCQTFL